MHTNRIEFHTIIIIICLDNIRFEADSLVIIHMKYAEYALKFYQ